MIYYLNKDTVPTIPTPHDCKIKKVTIQGDFIIFEFEDDISYHDSIRHFNPDAKSLVIKIHLVDDFDTYKMKYYKKPWCRGDYSRIDNAQLEKIAKNEEAITVLNGTGDGSVHQTVSDTIIKLVNGADTAYDTLKEISDYIANDTTNSAKMVNDISDLKNSIKALNNINVVSCVDSDLVTVKTSITKNSDSKEEKTFTVCANNIASTTDVDNVKTELTNKINSTNEKINKEITDRQTADNSLDSKINSEVTRIDSEIDTLESKISVLTGNSDINSISRQIDAAIKLIKGDFMAKCPKCGVKLHIWNIKAECPDCGVNIANYDWENRLEQDALEAEAAFAKMRITLAKFKYSFIGTKLRIARIPISVLPLLLRLLEPSLLLLGQLLLPAPRVAVDLADDGPRRDVLVAGRDPQRPCPLGLEDLVQPGPGLLGVAHDGVYQPDRPRAHPGPGHAPAVHPGVLLHAGLHAPGVQPLGGRQPGQPLVYLHVPECDAHHAHSLLPISDLVSR